MPKIKHINADILSDEEMTAFEDKFKGAERRMDEKLMEEIDRRQRGYDISEGGVWIPNKKPLQ